MSFYIKYEISSKKSLKYIIILMRLEASNSSSLGDTDLSLYTCCENLISFVEFNDDFTNST